MSSLPKLPRIRFQENGIYFGFEGVDGVPLDDPESLGLLQQLRGAEQLREVGGGELLSWSELYRLMEGDEAGRIADILRIPPSLSVAPRLRSHGALSSADFSISIDGWYRTDQPREVRSVTPVGALVYVGERQHLLPRESYELLVGLRNFALTTQHDRASNRRNWGHIRQLAIDAQANLDAFLYGTVVVTPEKLEIRLIATASAADGAVTVEPWFEGAPPNWLTTFDRFSEARALYSISTEQGIVHVDVRPDVQAALQVIKRMPGRRIAGERAESFLSNPFAALGPAASSVIDEEQFRSARDAAGLGPCEFSAQVEESPFGGVISVALVVSRLRGEKIEETVEVLRDSFELGNVINALKSHEAAGVDVMAWRRHLLSLTVESAGEIKRLELAFAAWEAEVTIRYLDVVDLTRYSSRISGIGEYTGGLPSGEIPRPESSPWLPPDSSSNSTGEESAQLLSVSVPTLNGPVREHLITRKVVDDLELQLEGAGDSGEIVWPGSSDRVAVADAREALRRVHKLWAADPGLAETAIRSDPVNRVPVKELLLHQNELKADYREEFSPLIFDSTTLVPRLPRALRTDVKLKAHQLLGVARMQALLDRAPAHCRGVVLGDDMGLGKSIQLLTLLASHFESDRAGRPALIVVPASLLQNWLDEIDRFFQPSAFTVLTLYGPALAQRRESKDKIDTRILEEGIKPRFLRPDWLGAHNVVLTTYETLRDLEFSLAATPWSLMICDEAQKIKNPDAFVTRAAKKQNAEFRIACTGTPVENSLQDLWCLFDFIQPGLLGSRLDFTRNYRRPIECDTDEQRDKIEELRRLIEPQIIRRTKLEVATDLPPKVIDTLALSIPISPMQRKLYAEVRQTALLRSPGRPGRKLTAWQILPRLREICSDPRESYERGISPILSKYLIDSPKLQWLLKTLVAIRNRGEKALVFCDLREIQRILVYAIVEYTGFSPDVINGDTEMSLSSATSRQKRLAAFQRVPGFGVIILSPLTVGFGVNIQAANHVIHFVRMWNPAKEDQATDRAYRIGQNKPVYVYYPTITAEFTTFDMKLHDLLEYKRNLSGDMLNGSPEVEPAEFVDALEFSNDAFNRTLTNNDVAQLTGTDFERFIAILWSKRGYSIKMTGGANDRGVDIVATAQGSGKLVQCKGSAQLAQLDSEGIKDVVSGAAFYGQKYPGITFEKVCVTNQRFNVAAQESARLNNVELLDERDIGEWLIATPVKVSELSVF